MVAHCWHWQKVHNELCLPRGKGQKTINIERRSVGARKQRGLAGTYQEELRPTHCPCPWKGGGMRISSLWPRLFFVFPIVSIPPQISRKRGLFSICLFVRGSLLRLLEPWRTSSKYYPPVFLWAADKYVKLLPRREDWNAIEWMGHSILEQSDPKLSTSRSSDFRSGPEFMTPWDSQDQHLIDIKDSTQILVV